MAKSNLPKSVRKHIRKKKAEIRRSTGTSDEKDKKIKEAVENISKQKLK